MTILQDECKPTLPKSDTDPVVELIAKASWEGWTGKGEGGTDWADVDEEMRESVLWHTNAILSALSEAKLAVLPLNATEEMVERFIGQWKWQAKEDWHDMATSFHPSQLETKRD